MQQNLQLGVADRLRLWSRSLLLGQTFSQFLKLLLKQKVESLDLPLHCFQWFYEKEACAVEGSPEEILELNDSYTSSLAFPQSQTVAVPNPDKGQDTEFKLDTEVRLSTVQSKGFTW